MLPAIIINIVRKFKMKAPTLKSNANNHKMITQCSLGFNSNLTVQAMAVSTATSMWPLYRRSLQPPPAFFNRLYHEGPSETVGRIKSIRKLIEPQSGW